MYKGGISNIKTIVAESVEKAADYDTLSPTPALKILPTSIPALTSASEIIPIPDSNSSTEQFHLHDPFRILKKKKTVFIIRKSYMYLNCSIKNMAGSEPRYH